MHSIIITSYQEVMAGPLVIFWPILAVCREGFFDHHRNARSDQSFQGIQITTNHELRVQPAGFSSHIINQFFNINISIVPCGLDHTRYIKLVSPPSKKPQIERQRSRAAVIHILLIADFIIPRRSKLHLSRNWGWYQSRCRSEHWSDRRFWC